MNKKWIAIWGSSFFLIVCIFAGVGFAESDKIEVHDGTILVGDKAEVDFPTLAKISSDQAVTATMASLKGQILKTSLEDENGFLIYGIEIVTADKSIMEVKVDAGSGKVLTIEPDNADDREHESNGKDEDD